jgi:hypothetical protein
MTPDDVAAIRAQAKAGYAIGPFHVMALVDALEATWAEMQRLRSLAQGWQNIAAQEATKAARFEAVAERPERDTLNIAAQYAQNADYWRERAERADAEHLNQVRLNLKMDAALARVRAVCDEMESFCCDTSPDWAADIRAAIEGDDQ